MADSTSWLHRTQHGSEMSMLHMRFSLVGRALTATLHKNIFNLSGPLVFQILAQFTLEGACTGRFSISSLYADFTKKQPLDSRIHMSLSGLGLNGKGMDRMACAELGLKMLSTNDVFQAWSSWLMRWATFMGDCTKDSTFGDGMKF